jgi:hypothetical protein
MNSNRLIGAIAIAVALTANIAFAQSATAADEPQPKTRAQVYAELEQARADGSFYSLGEGTPRRLTRARLAAHEALANRDRTESPETRAADRPAVTPQRVGS